MMQKQWNIFGKLFFSSVICLLMSLSFFTESEAQTSTPTPTPIPPVDWSAPVRFDENGWFPDLAVDSSGTIHLAWSSSVNTLVEGGEEVSLLNGYDTILYASSQDGIQWTSVVDIVAIPITGGSYATRPVLLTDNMGNLHMIYRLVDMFYTYTRIDKASDVNSWSSSFRVSAGNLSYFSRLIKDNNGRVHLIFTENVPSEEEENVIEFHIFHRYSDNNGQNWSIRSDISAMPLGSAKPQIVQDNNGHLHVVWESGSGGSMGMVTDPTSLYYSSSHDGGITWTTPYQFPVPANSNGKNIALGVNNDGVLLISWLNTKDNKVYSQFSTDGGRFWSTPEEIPGVYGSWRVFNTLQDSYSMATDSDGVIHFVMTGNLKSTDRTVDILHLSWNKFTWSEPDVVVDFNGDVPQWPRIVISNGNKLNIAWYVRDEANLWDTANGDYHVWFSSGISHAAYRKPQFWPTETPLPTVTSSPEPTPTFTTTPLPPEMIETPVLDYVGETTYTENDELLILLRSLVPAGLFLLLLFLAIRLFRRR